MSIAPRTAKSTKLKKHAPALGAVVEDAVPQGRPSARRERDAPSWPARSSTADTEIDQLEVDIEEECLKILALHQPVAIDLRFIIAVLKINNDLERIGDLAVNIAERRSRFLAAADVASTCASNSPAMVEKAQEMLKNSLDALVNLDRSSRSRCAPRTTRWTR